LHALKLDIVQQHGRFAKRSRDRRADRLARDRRRWRRRRRFRGRTLDLRLQLRDVHDVLDALAELRGDELHPLAQLAREQIRLVLGGFAERARVARVRVERDGRERHDREREERDYESGAEAHG